VTGAHKKEKKMQNILKSETLKLKNLRAKMAWKDLNEIEKYNFSHTSVFSRINEEKSISVNTPDNNFNYEPAANPDLQETGGEGYMTLISMINRIQEQYGSAALQGNTDKPCTERYLDNWGKVAVMGTAGMGLAAFYHLVTDPRGKLGSLGGAHALGQAYKFLLDAAKNLRTVGLGKGINNLNLDELAKEGFAYFRGSIMSRAPRRTGAARHRGRGANIKTGAAMITIFSVACAIVTDNESFEEWAVKDEYGEDNYGSRVMFEFFKAMGMASVVDYAIGSSLLPDLDAPEAKVMEPLTDACRWFPIFAPLMLLAGGRGMMTTMRVGSMAVAGRMSSRLSRFHNMFVFQNGFKETLRLLGNSVLKPVGTSGRIYANYWKNVLDDIFGQAGDLVGEIWFKRHYPTLGNSQCEGLRELLKELLERSANSARTLGDELLEGGENLRGAINANREGMSTLREQINKLVQQLIESGDLNPSDYLRFLNDMTSFDKEAILYSMNSVRGGGRFVSKAKKAWQGSVNLLKDLKEKLFERMLKQHVWPYLYGAAQTGARKMKDVVEGAKFVFKTGDDVAAQLDEIPRMRINLLDDAARVGKEGTEAVPLAPGETLARELVELSKASKQYEMDSLLAMCRGVDELKHLEVARKALFELGEKFKAEMGRLMPELEGLRMVLLQADGTVLSTNVLEQLTEEVIKFFRHSQGASKEFIEKFMDDLYEHYRTLPDWADEPFEEWLETYLEQQSKLPNTRDGIHSLLTRLVGNYVNPVVKTGRMDPRGPTGRLTADEAGKIFVETLDEGLGTMVDDFAERANAHAQVNKWSVKKKTAMAIAGIASTGTAGLLLVGLPQREIEESSVLEEEGNLTFNDNFLGQFVQERVNSLEGKSNLCQIIDAMLAGPASAAIWTGASEFPKEEEKQVKNTIFGMLIDTGAYYRTWNHAQDALENTLVKDLRTVIKNHKANTDPESERREKIATIFNKMQAKNGQPKYNFTKNLLASMENTASSKGSRSNAVITETDYAAVIITALLTKGTNVIERLSDINQNLPDGEMTTEIYKAWVYQRTDTADFIDMLQELLSRESLDCTGVRNWYTKEKTRKSSGADPGATKRREARKASDDRLRSQGGTRALGAPKQNTEKEEVKENISSDDLRLLVMQHLKSPIKENYNIYPYHSDVGAEEEEVEDFLQDWKDLCVNLSRDESRNTAIELAKILVKDLELFDDVLELVGTNQSTGACILRKMKKIK